MTDSSNNNNDIKDIIPKPKTEDLPTAETREEKFIRNLWLYPTAKEAALKAGYSEYTASSTIYVKMKTERFRNKIREYAIDNDLMALPKIGYIEDRIIDYLMENPLEASKHKHILKQKKQVAGVLGNDQPRPQPPTYNLTEVRAFVAQFVPKLDQKNIEEAEIIDTK